MGQNCSRVPLIGFLQLFLALKPERFSNFVKSFLNEHWYAKMKLRSKLHCNPNLRDEILSFLTLDLWTSLFKYFKIIAKRLLMAWILLVRNFLKRILRPNINRSTQFDDSESPGFNLESLWLVGKSFFLALGLWEVVSNQFQTRFKD